MYGQRWKVQERHGHHPGIASNLIPTKQATTIWMVAGRGWHGAGRLAGGLLSCWKVACHRDNRLTNWAPLLSIYLPRMPLRYRMGICHNNMDGPSRLRKLEEDSEEIQRRFPLASERRYIKSSSKLAEKAATYLNENAGVFVTSTSDVGVALSDEIKTCCARSCRRILPDGRSS
ncbi:hypothetical protein ACJ73_01684 [Blastomyces percursus]|uniref:Uncharacterized protein n=1 Tax=Blastomyces percursus TaxID=1658174 RepID=A0A1J9QFP6_9EURO|nr:hypothetical protein ACJ73_01684 [Blastomyces percursus]